ncbi:hypothetical protein DFH09DRAFT_1110022 [Mycena vulgaris]|nr:hypothetical protein DFH09DRAFT_1110022 [Mycena vulgaris]
MCTFELRKTGGGARQIDWRRSTCLNPLKFKIAAAKKSTKNSPCTNYLIPYPLQCGRAICTYNLNDHCSGSPHNPPSLDSIPRVYQMAPDELNAQDGGALEMRSALNALKLRREKNYGVIQYSGCLKSRCKGWKFESLSPCDISRRSVYAGGIFKFIVESNSSWLKYLSSSRYYDLGSLFWFTLGVLFIPLWVHPIYGSNGFTSTKSLLLYFRPTILQGVFSGLSVTLLYVARPSLDRFIRLNSTRELYRIPFDCGMARLRSHSSNPCALRQHRIDSRLTPGVLRARLKCNRSLKCTALEAECTLPRVHTCRHFNSPTCCIGADSMRGKTVSKARLDLDPLSVLYPRARQNRRLSFRDEYLFDARVPSSFPYPCPGFEYNPSQYQELRARSKESIETASEVRRRYKKFVSSCCEFIPCKEPSAPARARARVLFPAPNAEPRARTARDALEPRRVLRGGIYAESKGVGAEANWVQTSPRPRKSRGAAPKRVRTLTFGAVKEARRVRAHGLALQGRRRTLGERRVRDGARSSMAGDKTWAGTRVERSNAAAMTAGSLGTEAVLSRRPEGRQINGISGTGYKRSGSLIGAWRKADWQRSKRGIVSASRGMRAHLAATAQRLQKNARQGDVLEFRELKGWRVDRTQNMSAIKWGSQPRGERMSGTAHRPSAREHQIRGLNVEGGGQPGKSASREGGRGVDGTSKALVKSSNM